MRSIVLSLFITSKESEPMISVKSVRAVIGKGLGGDRYFNNTGTFSANPSRSREVTLLEIETLEAVKRDYGIDLKPFETRRNILTQRIALNHLVGKEFYIGEVQLRGVKLCEPCSHLEKLTTKGVRQALVHRGGLRAQIISDGTIYMGDEITTL